MKENPEYLQKQYARCDFSWCFRVLAKHKTVYNTQMINYISGYLEAKREEDRDQRVEFLWGVSLCAVALPLSLPRDEKRGYFSLPSEVRGASRGCIRESALCHLMFRIFRYLTNA